MATDHKIFGLMAQAEDIQKHTISLQGMAENVVKSIRTTAADAFKTLPDAARNAVSEAAKTYLAPEAEKASWRLLEASKGAIAAAEELRGAQTGALIKHVVVFFLVAVVISATIYFSLGFWAKRRAAELDALSSQG